MGSHSNPPSINGSKSALSPGQITFSEGSSCGCGRRYLVFLLFLLFIATVIFVALFLVYFFKYKDRENSCSPDTKDVCKSIDCVMTASLVADKMDASVDPCVDFDQFACGNFYKTTQLQEGETQRTSFSALVDKNTENLRVILEEGIKPEDWDYVKKMKIYYQSCIDEIIPGPEGLKPYLDSDFAKEYPTLIGQNWTGDVTFDLDAVNTKYMGFFVDALFSFKILPGLMDSTTYTLRLVDPNLGLTTKFLLRPRTDSVLLAYEAYLRKLALLLGADPAVAAQDAKDVVDMQIELAKIIVPKEERRDNSKKYNPMTLAEIARNYSFIDIPRALRSEFSKGNVSLSDDQVVTVLFPSYFEKLEAVLANANKRTLMNLYSSMYAKNKLLKRTNEMRELYLEWQMALKGKTEETPRWQTCFNDVTYAFSLALSKEFSRTKFSMGSKQYLDGMIKNLKGSFRDILRDAKWMSDNTKAEAFDKLQAMGRKIGYPDTNFDDEYFSKYYANMKLTPDDYRGNEENVLEALNILKYALLNKPLEEENWQMASYVVNAYYSTSDNEIVFPAGVLQAPLFSDKFPDSINYGAIGVVIGHEITHGFDDRGSQYDKTGRLRNWWAQEDLAKFNEKRQCLVDQYGSFRDNAVAMNVSGINTQGENVADNGGLKESFRAYKKLVALKGEGQPLPGLGLTHDQLFFLSYAQMWCDKSTKLRTIQTLANGKHPPGRYRTIGAVQNSREFAEAFKCPIGSPMNPTKKCGVW